MIPKIIHCCWFGGPKTKLAENCLASWRRFAPDWKIVEWKLEDLPASSFLDKAVSLKKWAVVSDWVRMWAMKECGGVYFDYDVELVKPIDDLREREWIASEWKVGGGVWLNPGSGIGLARGSALAQGMLELYERQGYESAREMMAVINTNLQAAMASMASPPQVLPPAVFSPIGTDGRMRRGEETRGIHWYAMSGAGMKARFCRWLSWHGMDGVVRLLRSIRRGVCREF